MYTITTPIQARSQQALERFLDAAAELLANDDFDDTGVARIAKLANSSVGTFYRLLGDKDTLLYAVHERFIVHSRDALDALAERHSTASTPLDVRVIAFTKGIAQQFENREGLLRALIRRSSTDLHFRQRFHQLNAHIAALFCRVALANPDEIGHRDPAQAADLCAHVLLATMNYFTVVGTLGRTARDVAPEELAKLLLSHLRAANA